MQRYFAKDKLNDNLILEQGDIHHIKNVMRNKVGDQIEVVYKKEVYIALIDSIEPLSIKAIKTIKEDRNLPVDLTVAVSLVNEQKLDLILQKLTELGVSTIIPIKTERSIVKLDSKKEQKKLERWQLICKEASEQSKRIDIPNVTNIMTLKELIKLDNQTKLLCSLNDDTKPLSTYLTKEVNDILFTIGPEGGFTLNEEKILLDGGFKSVSLGKRVMRVETAAIYVASIINYIYKG